VNLAAALAPVRPAATADGGLVNRWIPSQFTNGVPRGGVAEQPPMSKVLACRSTPRKKEKPLAFGRSLPTICALWAGSRDSAFGRDVAVVVADSGEMSTS
jgi:hypothetical protein